nr:MAG TPA: hypothetical protein [Caudoviricetes sp.]
MSVQPKTAAPLNSRKNSLNENFLERRQQQWHDQENLSTL